MAGVSEILAMRARDDPTGGGAGYPREMKDGDPSDAEALRETLAALEMPTRGLRAWFRQSQQFCNEHGGKRHYAELLALYDECLAALDDGAGDANGDGLAKKPGR